MIFSNQIKQLPRLAISLLFFTISAALTVQAQDERIEAGGRRMTARQLMHAIESQTNLKFAYSYSTLDPNRMVRLSEDVVTVRDALDCMVAGSDIKYLFQGQYVAFVPKGEVNRPQVQLQRTSDVYTRSSNDGDATPVARPATPQEWISQPRPMITAVEPVTYPASYSDYRPVDRYAGLQTSRPRFALKTNLLYGSLALAPNLAFEFATAPKQSVEISGSYNGWRRDENNPDDTKQLVHSILRAEYRWWLCEAYNGHFFGAHAFYSRYHISAKNIPMLFDKENRYDGYGVGVGATYGYNLPLGKQWGLEFNIGLGAAYLKNDKYTCAACDRDAVKSDKWYLGPTRTGITLVFQIK